MKYLKNEKKKYDKASERTMGGKKTRREAKGITKIIEQTKSMKITYRDYEYTRNFSNQRKHRFRAKNVTRIVDDVITCNLPFYDGKHCCYTYSV